MVDFGLLLVLLAGAGDDASPPVQSELTGSEICTVAESFLALTEPGELQILVDSAEAYRLRRRPDLHVKGALAMYRIAMLTEEAALLKRALYFLDRAEHRYSDNPCYFYYRGVVRMDEGAVKPFAARAWAKPVVGDKADKAIQDFRRAAQLRPDWLAPAAAMVQLATWSFEGRIGRRGRWRGYALEALDRYGAAGGVDPEAHLWHGRLLMDLDSVELALMSFISCRADSPVPVVEVEIARALFALGRRREAVDAYWRAVENLADSAVAAEFGRDLHYIFDPLEAQEWAELEPEARAAWARKFWSRRSARDLVTVEERLAEHYGRLHHVRTHYRRFTWGRQTVVNDQFRLPDEEVLDDRGLVYLILGKPDQDVICAIRNLSCTSWIYETDDRQPVPLTFQTGGSADWYLVSELNPEVYERLGSIDPYFYIYAWRMYLHSSRAPPAVETDVEEGVDPLEPMWADPVTRLSYETRERVRTEREADVTLARDRHRLPLDWLLEFGFEWLFFRGAEPGSVEATIAYGVPTRGLKCQAADGSRLCRLKVRASIFARDTVLAWRDVSGQVRLRGDPNTWLFGHLILEAAPGTWEYRLALFESPDSVAGERLRGNWGGGAFTVPQLWGQGEANRVSVSSLVLARPGRGNWVRGSEALALNPLHVYPPGATVELYYEIYGLGEVESYTTDIVLLPGVDPPSMSIDPSDEWVQEAMQEEVAALRLRFEESGARGGIPWLSRRKTLSLTDIEPGNYSLLLAITPADGSRTVYRVTPLRVDRAAR
jgi:GWxTD domain-containing protein